MPRIYGQKIMLREYRDSDFPHIRKWVNNPEVVKYLSEIFLYPQSEKQTRQFLDKAMSEEWKGFVIADKNTADYIGQIDFINVDQINGCAELGIVIGDLEKTSQGLGTEAIRLLLDYGFKYLRLQRVELKCYEFNKRGQRAYEKVGFTREGIKRKKLYRNGKFYDIYIYGILKEDWENIKET